MQYCRLNLRLGVQAYQALYNNHLGFPKYHFAGTNDRKTLGC
jgi:hypothetical protein